MCTPTLALRLRAIGASAKRLLILKNHWRLRQKQRRLCTISRGCWQAVRRSDFETLLEQLSWQTKLIACLAAKIRSMLTHWQRLTRKPVALARPLLSLSEACSSRSPEGTQLWPVSSAATLIGIELAFDNLNRSHRMGTSLFSSRSLVLSVRL